MRITAIALKTRDVAAQRDFWSGVLGLRGSGGAHIWQVELEQTRIVFEPAAAGTDPRYHYAIAIPRGGIDEAADWLSARVTLLRFNDDPEQAAGATRIRFPTGCDAIYFLDATGNVVELASCDAFAPAACFTPIGLRSVCEIGLAVTDPVAAQAVLCARFGESVYWGGDRPDGLTAVGDVHGMVLVSPIGRGWIPIDLTADPWPTRVTIQGARRVRVTLPDGPHVVEALPA